MSHNDNATAGATVACYSAWCDGVLDVEPSQKVLTVRTDTTMRKQFTTVANADGRFAHTYLVLFLTTSMKQVAETLEHRPSVLQVLAVPFRHFVGFDILKRLTCVLTRGSYDLTVGDGVATCVLDVLFAVALKYKYKVESVDGSMLQCLQQMMAEGYEHGRHLPGDACGHYRFGTPRIFSTLVVACEFTECLDAYEFKRQVPTKTIEDTLDYSWMLEYKRVTGKAPPAGGWCFLSVFSRSWMETAIREMTPKIMLQEFMAMPSQHLQDWSILVKKQVHVFQDRIHVVDLGEAISLAGVLKVCSVADLIVAGSMVVVPPDMVSATDSGLGRVVGSWKADESLFSLARSSLGPPFHNHHYELAQYLRHDIFVGVSEEAGSPLETFLRNKLSTVGVSMPTTSKMQESFRLVSKSLGMLAGEEKRKARVFEVVGDSVITYMISKACLYSGMSVEEFQNARSRCTSNANLSRLFGSFFDVSHFTFPGGVDPTTGNTGAKFVECVVGVMDDYLEKGDMAKVMALMGIFELASVAPPGHVLL